MRMGVFEARAAEADGGIKIERVIAWSKPWMLAREDQRRPKGTRVEGMCDRREFDRFRPRADDQYNSTRQPSP